MLSVSLQWRLQADRSALADAVGYTTADMARIPAQAQGQLLARSSRNLSQKVIMGAEMCFKCVFVYLILDDYKPLLRGS